MSGSYNAEMQHAHRQRSLLTERPDDTRQAVDLGPLVLAPFFHGRRARTELPGTIILIAIFLVCLVLY